ncbi:hypothetical protein GCM10023093_22180 [Nemorincola caseinilytica]|uniref:Uncharacterized protein n=1 Tax=Nemorincola caseinilytica TaxID=2054315 RepID=A0ABP8NJV8_9BACT
MSAPNNIPPTGRNNGERPGLSEERLLAYLEGRLSPQEQHEVELWLADEGMESDAVDGLRQMQTAERSHSINRLNHGLRKKLGRKKTKRRAARTDINTIVALLLVLLMAAITYLVIRYAI